MVTIKHMLMSVIPPGLQAPLGNLSKKAMSHASRDLKSLLSDCTAVTWGIAAFDFTFNDYTGKNGDLVHQPHFHGVLAVTDAVKVKALLEEQYPRTEEAYHPVIVSDYDLSNLGASYIFKTRFTRRSSYIDTGNPNRNPFSNTRPFKLRAQPYVDLALMLDFMSFDKRLIFIKMDPISMKFMKKLE